MSYAIIRTGGKQFAVEEGQTLRVPSIQGKEGDKVDIEALAVGAGKDAKFDVSTIKATVVGHGRGEKDHRFQDETPQTIQTSSRSPSGLHGN